MTDPHYSLATTNYNKADTLQESVTSLMDVADALPGPTELVVVDGGSSDGSVEILETLTEDHPRIRLIQEPSNLGEGRRIACEHARGDILIQHVDTDRVYDSAAAEAVSLYEQLVGEDRPDLILATFDSLYISHADVADPKLWPTLGRVEERGFVDRALDMATFRAVPVSFSRELPSEDTSGALDSARQWITQSRDMARVGFNYWTLANYHHQQFSPPKAFLADALAVIGYANAIRTQSEPIQNSGLLNSPDSWQIDALETFSDKLITPPDHLMGYTTGAGPDDP